MEHQLRPAERSRVFVLPSLPHTPTLTHSGSHHSCTQHGAARAWRSECRRRGDDTEKRGRKTNEGCERSAPTLTKLLSFRGPGVPLPPPHTNHTMQAALKPPVSRASLRGTQSSFAAGAALAPRLSALSLAPVAPARGAPLRCEGESRVCCCVWRVERVRMRAGGDAGGHEKNTAVGGTADGCWLRVPPPLSCPHTPACQHACTRVRVGAGRVGATVAQRGQERQKRPSTFST